MRRLPRRGARWVLVGIALPVLGASPQADRYRVEVVRHDADRRVDVLVDGKPFTSYIYPTTLKKPTLYPLRTASGVIVTRGWPLEPRPGERVDHPHQVGLWFDHGDVNGLDFWNNSDAIPADRASSMGTIVHRAVRRAASGAGAGTLEVTADWVNVQGQPLVREDTRFVFRAADGFRAVDRFTTLTALGQPVTFVDNKEGLIGLRVARALEQPSTTPEVFTDASGQVTTVPVLNHDGVTGRYRSSEGLEGDSVWGTRGRWTRLYGVVEAEPVTLAILDHPENVGFPTYWHARGYGLFAANPLGPKAFTNGKEELNFRLAPGQSTTFRYRVLILSGAVTPERIEGYYRDFVPPAQAASAAVPPNRLTEAERAAGWRLLFDGRTLAGWRGLGYDSVPTAHWVIQDGAIKKIASGAVPTLPDGQPLHGGDLITVATFGDFELTFDWKATPGANSGVKYNVSEELSVANAPNHAALGFEYQVLDDDRHEDGKLPTHRAGALYDLVAPNDRKHLRPVGEWNQSKVVFRGNHGEHWLNGEKIVEFGLGTPGMDSLLAASKYHVFPWFAERRRGHLVLQDHGDEVYFRNIKVRER
jgi:hypothetical protein